jgi:hypothetical protein
VVPFALWEQEPRPLPIRTIVDSRTRQRSKRSSQSPGNMASGAALQTIENAAESKSGPKNRHSEGRFKLGCSIQAACNKCKTHFTASKGGGRKFDLLHCDHCGAEHGINHDEIGNPYKRYCNSVEALFQFRRGRDENHIVKSIRNLLSGVWYSVSTFQYNRAVEKKAGKCQCGGRFKFDAPPRCPGCLSHEFTEIDPYCREYYS